MSYTIREFSFIITSYTCIDLMPQPKSDSNKPELKQYSNKVVITFVGDFIAIAMRTYNIFLAIVNVLSFRQLQRAVIVSMAQDFIECYKKSIKLLCESVFCGFVVSCLIAMTKFILKLDFLKVLEKLLEGYKHKSQYMGQPGTHWIGGLKISEQFIEEYIYEVSAAKFEFL
uniref:Uncharacterized protein n=1 Tax=Glossina austeni TaxID=7395 RepID=A0A1A9UPJ4_GLOAU